MPGNTAFVCMVVCTDVETHVCTAVRTDVERQMHTLSSHPTLSEPQVLAEEWLEATTTTPGRNSFKKSQVKV